MTPVLASDSVAIVSGGRAYSYRDLDDGSRRVAGALLGGEADLREARIAFRVTPGFEYAAIQHGVWRAGGIAVPLAASHPQAELDYVIADASARVVITDDTVRGLLAAPPPAALPAIAPSRRAMIVYTSGTTGRPKGVVTTHANIDAQVGALVEAWGWTASDRLLLVLPMHHVHGIINGLGSALAASATCEMHASFDAERVWDRLASGDITVFTAVPTIYHRLIASWDAAPAVLQQARADGARRARLMMSGSAALPVGVLERWRAITGHTLLERYGMTEIGMALANPLHGERRPGFVGTPLPRVEVRVVDEYGGPVPPGTAGELEVRGPAVFQEYWQRPAETRAAFRPSTDAQGVPGRAGGLDAWFRTGDVAVLENGSYRLLGRTSVDIIKTGGYKVSALEIEEVLRRHPAIAECAVVGVPDAEWGERVGAAVEVRPQHTLALPELAEWSRNELAPYKIPRVLRTVEALPRNAMGKVVKSEVARLLL